MNEFWRGFSGMWIELFKWIYSFVPDMPTAYQWGCIAGAISVVIIGTIILYFLSYFISVPGLSEIERDLIKREVTLKKEKVERDIQKIKDKIKEEKKS